MSMARWLAPYHGASEQFLRQHVSAATDDCIDWPYGKNANGYGLAVVNGIQRTASNWMCRLAHGEPFMIWNHAAHSCGNSACVNPKHLRWATHAENMADKNRHGTSNHGERNGKTKLTAEDVRAIRAAPPNLKPLMDRYGMSRDGISKIRSRRRWAHVR